MKNFLIKYNFIKIIPFEDTFYYVAPIPKNVKFSKPLLNLNYAKFSPFANPNILSYYVNQTAMIWFYKKTFDATFVIPESFILYNKLKKQKQNTIYIIHSDTTKVLIIKDEQLLDAFTLAHFDEAMLQLSTNEYQISHIKHISENEYAHLYDMALKELSLKDIYKFSQYDLDIKSISKNLINHLAYPLSALIIFSILLNYSHGVFLDKDISALKSQYLEQKNKNQSLKDEIRKHNEKIKKYQKFIQTELVYPDTLSLLDGIYKIFTPAQKATIKSVSISNGHMTLMLQTNINPVTFLNKLSQIKYLQNVIISASYKPRNAPKIITYDIDIKPVGRSDGL